MQFSKNSFELTKVISVNEITSCSLKIKQNTQCFTTNLVMKYT